MDWKYLATEPPPADDRLYYVAVHANGKTKVLNQYYTGAELRRITKVWSWTFYAYAFVEPIIAPPLKN